MPKEDRRWDAWGALSIKCLTLAQVMVSTVPEARLWVCADSSEPATDPLSSLSAPPLRSLALALSLKKNKQQKKEDQLKPDLPGRQWPPCSYPGLPIAADPPAYQGLGTAMMLWGCRGRGEALTCLKGQLWPRLFPAK